MDVGGHGWTPGMVGLEGLCAKTADLQWPAPEARSEGVR